MLADSQKMPVEDSSYIPTQQPFWDITEALAEVLTPAYGNWDCDSEDKFLCFQIMFPLTVIYMVVTEQHRS